MTRISTNYSSLVAQNRLRASTSKLQTALTRLSTGLRVNSAADDPAGLIASEMLRSEITGLSKAISNTNRAQQIVQTADAALNQLGNLLDEIRGLVLESANEGGLSFSEIAANQLQVDSSLEAINRIAQTTNFQGKKLLDGSLDFVSNRSEVPSLQDATINQAKFGSADYIDVDVVVQEAASHALLTAQTSGFTVSTYSSVLFSAGGASIDLSTTLAGAGYNDIQLEFVDNPELGDHPPTVQYKHSQKSLTIYYNSLAATATNRDVNAVISAINVIPLFDASLRSGSGVSAFSNPSAIGGGPITTGKSGGEVLRDDLVFQLSGSRGSDTFRFEAETSSTQMASAVNLVSESTGVRAFVSPAGLNFESLDDGSDSLINLEIIQEGANGTFSQSLTAFRDRGEDIKATVNGVQATGDRNTISINTNTLDLSLTVERGRSDNFSFRITDGGVLFQLGPDVTSNQQARLGIGSVDAGQLGGATGRLYQIGSGQSHALANDVVGAAQIVDEVINKISSVRGRLGAFVATTLETNRVNLIDTSTNLREAESSIRDADFAKESATLTRSQVLVQSGTNVLSLANQNPQSVLDLL